MNNSPPRVLITPLNWGLGHATRCIPVIKELLSQGYEVLIGANGAAATLLRQEFPDLRQLKTPGADIRYAKKGMGLALSMISLLPRLFRQLYEEKRWIRKIARELKPDLLISDNCYGLYHPAIPSVLITHQLNIKTGWGNFFDRPVQVFLYQLLNKFQEVWVPDWETEISFGGALSHPSKKPKVPVYYIGPLNRFSTLATTKDSDLPDETEKEKNLELLILLSGPEPQRSLLETILKKQLAGINKRVCLLRGLPKSGITDAAGMNKTESELFNNQQLPLFYGDARISILDHLPANQLQELIQKADIVLCRSGYTSLMELLPLQKKLILIPTPGQPEQHYLANYCKEKGVAITVKQQDLDLSKVLEEAAAFSCQPLHFPVNTNTKRMQERIEHYSRSLQ